MVAGKETTHLIFSDTIASSRSGEIFWKHTLCSSIVDAAKNIIHVILFNNIREVLIDMLDGVFLKPPTSADAIHDNITIEVFLH